MLLSCEEDLQQSLHKMNILNTIVDGSSSQCLESLRKQISCKGQPIILSEALNVTLDFPKMSLNNDELVRPFAPSSVLKGGEITECSFKTKQEKIKVTVQGR